MKQKRYVILFLSVDCFNTVIKRRVTDDNVHSVKIEVEMLYPSNVLAEFMV